MKVGRFLKKMEKSAKNCKKIQKKHKKNAFLLCLSILKLYTLRLVCREKTRDSLRIYLANRLIRLFKCVLRLFAAVAQW
jgi:hypothetical protein